MSAEYNKEDIRCPSCNTNRSRYSFNKDNHYCIKCGSIFNSDNDYQIERQAPLCPVCSSDTQIFSFESNGYRCQRYGSVFLENSYIVLRQ